MFPPVSPSSHTHILQPNIIHTHSVLLNSSGEPKVSKEDTKNAEMHSGGICVK